MINKRHNKRRWFTLIEMLVVIVIIGILAAYIIPRISSAQWKARDVARKADVNQLTSALISYSLDKKWFPVAMTWRCIIDIANDGSLYEWFDWLVDWWYISNISKDPGGKWVETDSDTVNSWWQSDFLQICTGNYYGYISNWDHFVIIAYMDDPENWNYCTTSYNGIGEKDETKAWTLHALAGKSKDQDWNTEFKNIRKRLADNNGCPAGETYPFYIYAY